MRRRLLLGSLGLSGMAAFAFREMERPIGVPDLHPDPQAWPDTGLHAAWLGHSTVLLKVDGMTIVTDPVFSDRIGLNFGPVTVGMKRLVAPAMRLNKLPKVDLILLSHAHMDHLDIPTLRLLEDPHTAVVMAHKTSDLLRASRYREVREMRWGDKVRVGAVQLRALEVKHWGARMRTDTYRGYNGYLIDAGRYRILFGGDTAFTSAFRTVRSSRGVDLAIMPIGAYNPWIHAHCTPEQAWQMGNDAGAERFIPIHHQTFQLSREPLLEPIERFYAAAGAAPERIAIGRMGQEFSI